MSDYRMPVLKQKWRDLDAALGASGPWKFLKGGRNHGAAGATGQFQGRVCADCAVGTCCALRG
ncbi:hypothetical protein PCAR4_250089 [Paraburkholderia caribensis]|nr:hypothetical protein PCAR4_250089 [Paraburkholderia caribensis]